jgi:enoyl-CoA hydratase
MTRSESQREDVTYELTDSIGVITIARPPVNAMRTRTFLELEEVILELNDNDACHVIVLRSGIARAFSAGADLAEMPMPLDDEDFRFRLTRRTLDHLLRSRQPVICAVDGPARGGGCALAAACDIRVASDRSSFAMPEIKVGRGGGARHLMRVLPQGTVRLAYFTGNPIDASEAYRLGMVQRLTSSEPGAVDAAAMVIAVDIAAKNPVAIRLAKEALDLAETMTVTDGYRVEQQNSHRLSLFNRQAQVCEPTSPDE